MWSFLSRRKPLTKIFHKILLCNNMTHLLQKYFWKHVYNRRTTLGLKFSISAKVADAHNKLKFVKFD